MSSVASVLLAVGRVSIRSRAISKTPQTSIAPATAPVTTVSQVPSPLRGASGCGVTDPREPFGRVLPGHTIQIQLRSLYSLRGVGRVVSRSRDTILNAPDGRVHVNLGQIFHRDSAPPHPAAQGVPLQPLQHSQDVLVGRTRLCSPPPRSGTAPPPHEVGRDPVVLGNAVDHSLHSLAVVHRNRDDFRLPSAQPGCPRWSPVLNTRLPTDREPRRMRWRSPPKARSSCQGELAELGGTITSDPGRRPGAATLRATHWPYELLGSTTFVRTPSTTRSTTWLSATITLSR